MRVSRFALLLFFCSAITCLHAQEPGYRLDVIQETTVFEPVQQGLYRFVTCPDGKTVLTHFQGAFILVGADGRILRNNPVSPLTEVTGLGCDDEGRLYVAAKGDIWTFQILDDGRLTPEGHFQPSGMTNRIQATPNGEIYAVGRSDDGFLRRFRLDDGRALDVARIDVPQQFARSLDDPLGNGALLWHEGRQELIYFHMTPAMAWSFDLDGKPAVQRESIPISPYGTERIRNAVALPGGRILLQVFPGLRPGPQPLKNLTAEIQLVLLDADFRVIADDIEQPFLALLSGADAEGNLYFADLGIHRDGKLIKARLTSQTR